jgi:hypothetical protein
MTVVLDPAAGVELCLGDKGLSAGGDVAEAIGDPLPRAGRAAVGSVGAGTAQVADHVVRPYRAVQAGLARRHLKWNIRAAFARCRNESVQDIEI